MDFYRIWEAVLLAGVKSRLFTLNRRLLPPSGGRTEWHFQVKLTDGESRKGRSHSPDSGKLD